jgi:tetratricopeptide (TPR) repeat protein
MVSSCGRQNSLSTRYAIEKAFYDAQRLELRAYAEYPGDDYAGWRAAMDAYDAIAALDSLFGADENAAAGTIVNDCRRVILQAKIGRLRLAHLDYRLHDAVAHPSAADADVVGRIAVPWEEPLEGTSSLYGLLEPDPTGTLCANLLQEVAGSPVLWSDYTLARDSLLVIPLSLAVAALRTGEGASALAFAESFYTRVIATWSDVPAAVTALGYRARARGLGGRYAAALADVDSVLSVTRHPPAPERAAFVLLRGELIAFGAGDAAQGRRVLREVVSLDPGSAEAWMARLCLAMLAGDEGGGSASNQEALRALAIDAQAPADIRSRALLMQAVALEESGAWEDASAMLWQICRLYPYTAPALAAPLRVIRHHAASGDVGNARRACEKASEFYMDVTGRNSAMIRPRYLPQDYFVEAHLLSGSPRLAAEGLERASATWRGDNAAAARLKSALIYNYILGDGENSVRIMQKSLALSSGSRYLRATRRELDRIAPARGAGTVIQPPGGSR